MAKNKHVYLMQENQDGSKTTVYPVTDVSAVIGLENQKGDLLSRLEKVEKDLKALEDKVNYH